jgi:drug/metabolite transporter (DMT)-like permease
MDEGLIGLLLVAGVVLFLFPEPSTSAFGILLIVTGLLGWAIDAIIGE